eukprot:14310773-Alexandrium_andersonii.AAC.1
MQKCFKPSKLEPRGPENDLKFHPGRSRPGGSASLCALSPMERSQPTNQSASLPAWLPVCA